MDALMALSESQLAQRFREPGMSSFCNPAATGSAATPQRAPKLPLSPEIHPLPLPLVCKIQKKLRKPRRPGA
jgi:hypothetical protein